MSIPANKKQRKWQGKEEIWLREINEKEQKMKKKRNGEKYIKTRKKKVKMKKRRIDRKEWSLIHSAWYKGLMF